MRRPWLTRGLSRQERKGKQSVHFKKLFLSSEDSTTFTYLEPHECSPHVTTIKVEFNIITLSMRRFLVIILNPLVYFYVGRPVVDNICGEFDDQVSIYECFKNSHGYRYIMTEQKGTKLSSRFQEVKTTSTHHSHTCGPARIPF
jgi:hypothetical protein